MANLANVTRESRLILKIGTIVIGVGILFYFALQGYFFFKKLTSPPVPPLQSFGKLPEPVFPTQGTPGIQFQINTVDGALRTFGDRANVYKLTPPQASLLDLSNAKEVLESAGFIENQIKISDTLYQWSQTGTGVLLQYDIVTKNFALSSNYFTNPSLTSTSLMPPVEDIKKDVISFLQLMGADVSDINIEKSTVTYLQNNGGQLIKAENLANAKFARVELVQNPVNEIPFVYETPTSSLLNFLVSYPTPNNALIVEGQFFHYQIDVNEKSDYPLKTTTQAFNDLKNGDAYMINPQNLTTVDITDVELRYYIGTKMNGYLIPVYLFTGINFAGYVNALPNSSLTVEN